MMEKLAQAADLPLTSGEGGGCTPIPFNYCISTITHKAVVYAQAERADTVHSTLFLLYPYMLYVGRKFRGTMNCFTFQRLQNGSSC